MRPVSESLLKLDGRLALRAKEAAKALGISVRTLRRWRREEGLPYFRVSGSVFFRTADLQDWMQDRTSSEAGIDEIAETILRDL